MQNLEKPTSARFTGSALICSASGRRGTGRPVVSRADEGQAQRLFNEAVARWFSDAWRSRLREFDGRCGARETGFRTGDVDEDGPWSGYACRFE